MMKVQQFKILALGAVLSVGLITSAYAQTSGINNKELNKLNSLVSQFSANPLGKSKADIQLLKKNAKPQQIIINENITFENLSANELLQAQINISEKVEKQLEQYQKLGLYNNIGYVKIFTLLEINDSQADLDANMVMLHIDKKSSINNIILKDEVKFSFQKIVLHKLAHVQFNKMPLLVENDSVENQVINAQINSNLPLEIMGLLDNTSRKFVQENIADTYAQLAYMKINSFNDESIAELKEDLKVRLEMKKINSQDGQNLDSHDTCESLQSLIDIVSDPQLREKIKSLPGKELDGLAKSLVFNTYKDYMQKDNVKAAVESNIANGHVDKITAMLYKEMKLPTKVDLKARISEITIGYTVSNNTNKLAKLN